MTTPTLEDKTYSLTVTATDAAGNVSATSDALSITIDALAQASHQQEQRHHLQMTRHQQ